MARTTKKCPAAGLSRPADPERRVDLTVCTDMDTCELVCPYCARRIRKVACGSYTKTTAFRCAGRGCGREFDLTVDLPRDRRARRQTVDAENKGEGTP